MLTMPLNFASSVTSWAGLLRLVDIRWVYPISYGSKRVISPRSTDANLSRRFTQPSCECSRAGRIYHNLMALRSEFGVSDCLFCQCSPKA